MDGNPEYLEYYGALSHLRTEISRRRFPIEEGEESYLSLHGMSPYEVDLIIISNAKFLRRNGDKTQVFYKPSNAHVRTRLNHMVEVANIGLTMSHILGLNKQLTYAGGLGHDGGHTPFGHMGESFLQNKTGKHFHHAVFGVIVCQKIERKGLGLNLTNQTLSLILNHSSGVGTNLAIPQQVVSEGKILMLADKIAYIWSDINDIQRFNPEIIVNHKQLAESAEWFGKNQRERVQKTIIEVCKESAEHKQVSFSTSEAAQRFAELKEMLYQLYYQFDFRDFKLMDMVYDELGRLEKQIDPTILFALISDAEAMDIYRRLEKGDYLNKTDLNHYSIGDMIPYLREKKIDFTDPDMDW